MSKYTCILCNERKCYDTAHILHEKIGICVKCFGDLGKTAASQPYHGTKDISYIMAPFEYTGKLREAILNFKFKNCWGYAPVFANMMREYINSYDIWNQFDYIIPVPLHKKRLRERGYNQSELIAKHISEYIKIPMRTDLLRRTRATKRQSSLKNSERVINVLDAFNCADNLEGRNVLLADDICTTGSTLQSCATALKAANAGNICALTFTTQIQKNLPIITY